MAPTFSCAEQLVCVCALTNVRMFFLLAFVGAVQGPHQAKEWLSVVSELTLRLNKGA